MILRQPKPTSTPGFQGRAENARQIGPFRVSRNRYASGAYLHRHAHRHAFISFVIAGAYTEYCGWRANHCPPGTLGFHPAGEEHSDRFDRSDADVLSIEVRWTAAEDAPRMGARFLGGGPEARLASHIVREVDQRCPASDLIIECLATELVSGSREPRVARGTPHWLAAAVEIANDGYADRLELAHVASLAGVHPVHLARQFRSRLGCTFGEYVRRIRLVRALERLRGTAQPIVEVAAATGFADQSHLTRLMTATLGVTPAAYRRHWRAAE